MTRQDSISCLLMGDDMCNHSSIAWMVAHQSKFITWCWWPTKELISRKFFPCLIYQPIYKSGPILNNQKPHYWINEGIISNTFRIVGFRSEASRTPSAQTGAPASRAYNETVLLNCNGSFLLIVARHIHKYVCVCNWQILHFYCNFLASDGN